MNYVYILMCADGSLYTGWTNRLPERVAAHNGKGRGGAKYTRARRPVSLVYFEAYEDAREAMRREYAVKQLSRAEKEALVASMDSERLAEMQTEKAQEKKSEKRKSEKGKTGKEKSGEDKIGEEKIEKGKPGNEKTEEGKTEKENVGEEETVPCFES